MPMSLRALKNSRNLLAALRDASLDDIDYIIQRLVLIKEKLKNDRLEDERRKAKRQEALNKAMDFLNENNISIDDLLRSKDAIKHKRAKFKIRYKYTDIDGVQRTWTGQGKTPTPLRLLMERDGTTKENYKIDEE